MKTRQCAADRCKNRFEPTPGVYWQMYCSELCATKMRVKRYRARQKGAPDPHGPKQLPLLGESVSASDKKRGTGILLTSRPQLRLPLSIAAALALFAALLFLHALPVYAASSLVGVQGASPQDANLIPAKAGLRKVIHRKPVPFVPHASEPGYLACFVTETLECGHLLDVFPQSDPLIAVRRRCQECNACDAAEIVAIASGRKKPPRRADSPRKIAA